MSTRSKLPASGRQCQVVTTTTARTSDARDKLCEPIKLEDTRLPPILEGFEEGLMGIERRWCKYSASVLSCSTETPASPDPPLNREEATSYLSVVHQLVHSQKAQALLCASAVFSQEYFVLAARYGALVWTVYMLAIWVHELAHVAVALALGYSCAEVDLYSLRPSVRLTRAPTKVHEAWIRNAGWIASVIYAIVLIETSTRMLAAEMCGSIEMILAAAVCSYTACEAIYSDLLVPSGDAMRFFCGNFGMLLFQQASADKVDLFLRRMLKVTMMRGAQSAGVVTYQASSAAGVRGVRHRVVNGKRTDLSDKLFDDARAITRPKAISAPQVFQGHTRFATSSIADLAGTHPHQWTPKSKQRYWWDGDSAICDELRNVEGYITHNGDLDFFDFHGTTYALGDVQAVSSLASR
jgi:hypothetical protein